MIKFERSKMMIPVVQQAMTKLYGCRKFKDGYGFQVGVTLRDILEQNDKEALKLKEILLSLCEKDEEGNPIIVTDGTSTKYAFSDYNKHNLEEDTKASFRCVIEVPHPKLHLSKLDPARLSSVEYAMISFLIDETV